MHEMALAEGILAVALDAADGKAIRRIRVRVGVLQQVVPDSLQFCLQLAAEDTLAAQAVLEMQDVLALLRCRDCGAEDELPTPTFTCSRCGSADLDALAGDEVLVDGVETESGWHWRPGAEDEDENGGGGTAVEIPASHLAEHARQEAEAAEAQRADLRGG